MNIAYVISSHGYGHATRAAAVMAAIHDRRPEWNIHVYSALPPDVLRESLRGPFEQHAWITDVGIVQHSALEEDLEATVTALHAFYPPSPDAVSRLAANLREHNCSLVMCDIAPIGIAAAREASLPSVLVENFLWDFIYSGYVESEPRLRPFIDSLGALFAQADYHIQTEPVCVPLDPDLTVPPVSRRPRRSGDSIRRQLGLSSAQAVILVTMGGLDEDTPFLEQLRAHRDYVFVLPGTGGDSPQRKDNVVMLPRHSGIYHPDLVNAADAVVGKLGYSTLAEVYWSGQAFGYVIRERFNESGALGAFADREMRGARITPDGFRSGEWLTHLETLATKPRLQRKPPNGADRIAEYLVGMFGG